MYDFLEGIDNVFLKCKIWEFVNWIEGKLIIGGSFYGVNIGIILMWLLVS